MFTMLTNIRVESQSFLIPVSDIYPRHLELVVLCIPINVCMLRPNAESMNMSRILKKQRRPFALKFSSRQFSKPTVLAKFPNIKLYMFHFSQLSWKFSNRKGRPGDVLYKTFKRCSSRLIFHASLHMCGIL